VASAALALVGATAAPAGAALICGPRWNLVPTPAGIEVPFDVAIVSPDDAWIVGSGADHAVAARWDSQSWTEVGVPGPPGADSSTLRAVDVLSPTDAWAVGDFTAGADRQTFIVRWSGTQWENVPSPSPSSAFLEAVAAAAPGDVWAVGHSSDDPDALILHWDGLSWRNVRVPATHGDEDRLYDVAVASPTDVWAVGYARLGSEFSALTMHWNGIKWTRDQIPAPPHDDRTLAGITAIAPDDIWAVGSLFDQGGTGDGAYTLHRQGGVWQEVPTPALPGGDALADVAAVSTAEVWAVGSRPPSYEPLSMRWEGTRWNLEPFTHSRVKGELYGVDAAGSGHVWAAGPVYGSPTQAAMTAHLCH
jgi:hypothetical protein